MKVFFALAALVPLFRAQEDSGGLVESVNKSCLLTSDHLAGTVGFGDAFSDYEILERTLTTKMRMWGFQICLQNQQITGFRVNLADEYGQGDFVDLNAAGPLRGECKRFRIDQPELDQVKRIDLHWTEVVLGMTIRIGEKTRSFGQTQTRQTTSYEFADDKPLIGIYGETGASYINALGFISYDLGEECQNDQSTVNRDPDPDNSEVLIDPVTGERIIVVTEEPDGLDVRVIGAFTAAGVGALMLILVVVLCCERHKRNRNITEVVELKPVDIEEHRKGIAERQRKQMLESAQKQPAKIPVPVMQEVAPGEANAIVKQAESETSAAKMDRGGTKYRAEEADHSSTAGMETKGPSDSANLSAALNSSQRTPLVHIQSGRSPPKGRGPFSSRKGANVTESPPRNKIAEQLAETTNAQFSVVPQPQFVLRQTEAAQMQAQQTQRQSFVEPQEQPSPPVRAKKAVIGKPLELPPSMPPQAAMWTSQVVELPPIQAPSKAQKSKIFIDEASDSQDDGFKGI